MSERVYGHGKGFMAHGAASHKPVGFGIGVIQEAARFTRLDRPDFRRATGCCNRREEVLRVHGAFPLPMGMEREGRDVA